MGVDLTVLIADWPRILQTPPDDRLDVVQEAAYSDEDDADLDDTAPDDCPVGWISLPPADSPWLARYEFHGTLGSFKPHFRAGQAWEDVRDFAEPALRTALDAFLSGLYWAPPEADDADADPDADPDAEACADADPLFSPNARPWRSGPVFACPPSAVTALADSWAAVASRLPDLRAPYGVHAARPGRWIADFDEFCALLGGWGEVTTEAARRGWGVIGLPL